MLRQEVQRFRCPYQVLDGCPMFVAGALLGFDVVLDVDEQTGAPGALLRLAGGAGPSDNPSGQGFLGIVSAQGFQTGKLLLTRSPGRYVLVPFQFIPFPLKATERVLQVCAAGQEPVDGGAELHLVAGDVLFRSMLNIALALIPAGDNDGQTTLLSDPVTSAADLMVASLVGVVVPVILETDRIEDPVIISMVLVNVKGVDILASAGTLGFGSLKICVRVKSTDAPVDWMVLDGRCDEKLWCRIRLVSVMERFQIFHYQ